MKATLTLQYHIIITHIILDAGDYRVLLTPQIRHSYSDELV